MPSAATRADNFNRHEDNAGGHDCYADAGNYERSDRLQKQLNNASRATQNEAANDNRVSDALART
jgi:hypothetical protein